MFNSLMGRSHVEGNELPGSPRKGHSRNRRHEILTLAAALAAGAAMILVSQPAQAASVLDGQWTVSHGGTGQVSLNSDGTYTSTCVVNPNYADAWCPAPSGTFQYSTMGSASITFNGTDGSSHSYRVSGDVYRPDTITSAFGSRTYSPLVMRRGSQFVCTLWSGTGTSFTRWGISPEVEYDAASNLLYATGSHDLIGPKNIDTQVNLAETAPNYFRNGTSCASVSATHHIGDLDNATASLSSLKPSLSTKASSSTTWQPRVAVTVLNANGVAVTGATVRGTFSHHRGTLTCVTASNGICTLGNFSLSRSTTSTAFKVTGVAKASSTYTPKANSDPDGDSNGTTITLERP